MFRLRLDDIFCFLDEHTRVHLNPATNVTASDYINANAIVSLYQKLYWFTLY